MKRNNGPGAKNAQLSSMTNSRNSVDAITGAANLLTAGTGAS